MTLAEGVSTEIRYKFYSSGVINSNSEPDLATDPGSSGGQVLRRVSSGLTLSKDTFQSNEVRRDRQIADFRHGVRRAAGPLAGELSCGTYRDFFEAVFRSTWTPQPTVITEAEATSLAADATLSTITLGSGDPIALGVRVGSILVATNLSAAGNNNVNFLVTSLGGTGNRTLTVHPAPTTMTADTDFDLTVKGSRLVMPSSGFTSRKALIEFYSSDVDVSRLFTECRFTGFNLNLPPNDMATIDFGVTGRNMVVNTGVSAPYFTAPTAETTTGVLAAPNGVLVVNGAKIGVVTELQLNVDLSPDSGPVVGQNFVPEVFLGRFNGTGQMSAYFENADILNYFLNETDISLISMFSESGIGAVNAMSLVLPRIKLGNADIPVQGEGGQMISMPFQALKYGGSVVGLEQTTMQIVDTSFAA